MIANSASLGAPNLNLVHDIDVSDGLLDVIVVREADLESLLSVVTSITDAKKIGKPLPHWQVREVLVEADPPMAVTGDGEIWESDTAIMLGYSTRSQYTCSSLTFGKFSLRITALRALQ